jgi:class 3 adenylate cyclase/tetratricopeptide (TPR) repeat protein
MLVRMAACLACGSTNLDRARFCATCGTPLGVPCGTCGAVVPADARFCPSCGAAVDTEEMREERKVVTVLFCDLVGSTSGAEHLDPEDVRATLAPYSARLRTEIERFGGTVEKFVGDAVMALFGAPRSHEDDPERAVRAALAIRDAVAELNLSGLPMELRVRIGINTGEVLVALGARPGLGEGMAAGDVVNTAARLEQAARSDSILVGEAAYRATRDAIEYAEVAPVTAKGKEQPVRAWEARATRAPAAPDLVDPSRSPLIGRDDELDVLRGAFDRVRRDRTPQLVTLVGVPGIGKSRLVAELAAAVAQGPEAVVWRQGRSLPYGDGVTFWALAEMTKAQAGILHSDGAAAAAAKLHDAVAALVADESEARWIERQLRPLVGLDLGREGARRDVEFGAWRRLFESMAERHPLVLVFEDLHWADDALLDFVDELVDRSVDVPLLVVGTTRPELFERRPGWGGGKRNALTITLTPLDDAEAARLLSVLLDRAVLPAHSQAELLLLVGGVPLCAEEYVRMLDDRGLIRHGRLTGELPLPETVQGIIAARLDALAAPEKSVVQAASVLGRSFWLGGLAMVTGVGEAELEERLLALERKEFVRRERRSTVANERQYTFRHVLLRDVAYAQIPRRDRVRLHVRAAEWIDSLAPERAEERAEMLAYHYLAALEFARAVRAPTDDLEVRARRALREAGDRAAALQAFAAAARFYGDALELWPADDPETERVRLLYGQALVRSDGRGAEIVATARDGLLARGDTAAAAEAEAVLVDLAWREGRHEDAVAAFTRAAALLDDLPSSDTKAYVSSRLATFLMADGSYEEAVGVGERTRIMADELGRDDLKASALISIGVARVNLGDARGLDDLNESLALALRQGAPEPVVRGHFNVASTLANLGDLEHAFDHYGRGAKVAARLGDPAFRHWFAAEGLYECWWRGAWDKALSATNALRHDLDDETGSWIQLDAGIVCGAILCARGELDAARSETEAALEFGRSAASAQALLPALGASARYAVEVGERQRALVLLEELLALWHESQLLPGFWVADAAVVAVDLGLADGFIERAVDARAPTRWLQAAEAYVEGRPEAAADLYERIGSRPDEAHARLRAAGLRMADRPEDADRELRRALAFYRETGARRILARAEPLVSALAS